jgi:GT2 family glycosyltransferase
LRVLVFGCCVGPSGKFATVAEPSLAAVMAPEDVLVREQGGDGICAAYNRILQQARAIEDCEGVVLLHDDVSLGDQARQQLLAGMRAPGAGIVGVVGGRGLFGPQWVDARQRAGYADDFYGWRRYGPATADVDVVDGLLLAISPATFRSIEFDEDAFPAFHGYDTDYCLQARHAGHRVRVVHVDYVHRDKGGVGDGEAFDVSARALETRWPDLIRPLGPVGRLWRTAADRGRETGGRVRHLTMSRIKTLAARVR